MGDTFGEGDPDEQPVHAVYVDTFYMDRCAVTNQQYADALNWAYTQGNLITLDYSGAVYQYGSGTSYWYCSTNPNASQSQITWNGATFVVVSGKENHPMVWATWCGSAAYANWRSAMESRQLCFDLSTWTCDFSKNGYHLATEAQWEYAARGGLKDPYSRFPWGDTINQTRVNFQSSAAYSYDVSPVKNQYHPIWNDGVYPYTSPVGFFDGAMKNKTDYNWPSSETSYQTENGGNGYGLYDMAGNVSEWCNDWYGSYSSSTQTNPTGPITGDWRVLRGGFWYYMGDYCRVASRRWNYPTNSSYLFGFRVSLDF
jgi:formylglycine-generating enzyme required for sulfatase activity